MKTSTFYFLFFRFSVVILLSTFYFLFSGLSFAATSPSVYFGFPVGELAPQSEFSVDIVVGAAEKPINAVDFEISYSANLEFIGSNNAGSIIDIWQQNPRRAQNGVVSLSGGIFRGFMGKDGKIIQLNFKTSVATSTGWAKFNFAKPDVYLADGLGTKVSAIATPLILPITLTASPKNLIKVGTEVDVTPPVLEVGIARNPVDGAEILVFNAVDRESGVRETLVRMNKWFSWDVWRAVANPVKLAPNTWFVQIKSTNGNGVETQKTLFVWLEVAKQLGILFTGLLVLGGVLWFIMKKRRKNS